MTKLKPILSYISLDSLRNGVAHICWHTPTKGEPMIPVLTIPLTKEVVTDLLAKADTAHSRGFGYGHPENAVNSTGRLRRALAAIGVKVPRAKIPAKRAAKGRKRT